MRADGIQLLAAGGIKVAAKHHLPEAINAGRILADDHGRALLHRLVRTSFSHSCDPGRSPP